MPIIVITGLIVLRGSLGGHDPYGAFLRGAEKGMRASAQLLPALCAMLAVLSLAQASGLTDLLARTAAPLLSLLGLPREIAPILLLRPLTGSGSLSALGQVFAVCGPDSRAGRIASVLVGSSETIFYTLTVYLAGTDIKRLPFVIPVSLISYLAGAAAAGALIR